MSLRHCRPLIFKLGTCELAVCVRIEYESGVTLEFESAVYDIS